jgi:hypothetical protein
MQLKTQITRSDINKYYKIAQNRIKFIHSNPVEDIYEKIQKNYHLAIIIDEKGDNLIGSIVCKIDNDFFSNKQCTIIDFFTEEGNNFEEISNMLFDWILQISQQYLCHNIIFESFTANKIEQKFFSNKKFILEKFLFVKNL